VVAIDGQSDENGQVRRDEPGRNYSRTAGGQFDLNVTAPAAITNVLAAAVIVDRTSLSVLLAAEGSGAKAGDICAELILIAATLIPPVLVAELPQFPALLLLPVAIVVIVVPPGLCLGCAEQPE
jgi:hypothetical protein